MKPILPSVVCLIGLAVTSCSTRPTALEVVPSPTGGYCSNIEGYLSPDEVRARLLFASAEATLVAGDRYFRVRAVSGSGSPLAPMGPQDQSGGFRTGQMCFSPDSGPAAAPHIFDATSVVTSASPYLQKRLAPAAHRTLEALLKGQPDS